MEKAKLAELVREIGRVAPRVGKEYAEQQAAFEAERRAEEKLLASVIEMARPGLPAIANPISSSTVPGVLLWEGKTREGEALRVYLQTDGVLWEEWETKVISAYGEVLGTQAKCDEQSVRYIIEKYDVADLVAKLHAALTKQVGRREPSTATARDGAAKLNAILTLLDVPQEAKVVALSAKARAPTGKDALTGEDLPF